MEYKNLEINSHLPLQIIRNDKRYCIVDSIEITRFAILLNTHSVRFHHTNFIYTQW